MVKRKDLKKLEDSSLRTGKAMVSFRKTEKDAQVWGKSKKTGVVVGPAATPSTGPGVGLHASPGG